MDTSGPKLTPRTPYKIDQNWDWTALARFLSTASLPSLFPLSLTFLSTPGFCLQQSSCFSAYLYLFHASIRLLFQFPRLVPFLNAHSNFACATLPRWDSCPAHGCLPLPPTVWGTHSLSCNWLCPPHGSCPSATPFVQAAPSCSGQWAAPTW